MRRRRFLSRAVLATAAGRGWGSPRPERRPNIVLIVAGRWRGQAFPFAGDRYIKAPNADRLHSEGVWFERAYTPNPSGRPARAAIVTGLYPHRTGVIAEDDRLSPDRPALANWLREAGYVSAQFGRRRLEEGGVTAGLDEAVSFVGQTQSQPLFASLELELKTASADERPESNYRVRQNVPAENAWDLQPVWDAYYRGCSAMDDELGHVLDAIDQSGAAEDTVVVFTADCGEMLGSHGLSGGDEPFEEAVRVPLLVRYPARIRKRQKIAMPVSTLSVAPTILALAGLDMPEGIQGRDLSNWLLTGDGERSESAYCQGRLGTGGEWRMLVRGLDKLVIGRNLEVTHLFNLGRDRYEMENLASDKDYRRQRDELRAVIVDRMQRARDKILPSGLKLRD